MVAAFSRHARSISRPSSSAPVTNTRPRSWTATGSSRLTVFTAASSRPGVRYRNATIEVCTGASSSSSGAASTSSPSRRASAVQRAMSSAMPWRPRCAMVAQTFSARNGRVCSMPYSENQPSEPAASSRR